MIKHALQAVQSGFAVFPVEPNDKTPARDGQYLIRWPEYATTVVGRVVQYWQHWPRANVGIACAPSGVLVVDCDSPKSPWLLKGTQFAHLHDTFGPYTHGMDVAETLFKRLGISHALDTYTVTTGSGGFHLYYQWPASVRASQGSIVPGVLDIRCNAGDYGGYVLGPGSTTASGNYYPSRTPSDPILPAPDILVELLREKPKPPPRPRSPFAQPLSGDTAGLQRAILLAPEGNRNNVLHWAACCMRDDGHTEDKTVDTLVESAERIGLTQQETRATIASAYRNGNR